MLVSYVLLGLDLIAFWVMVVTGVLALIGKVSGKVPLIALIVFVAVLIITFMYEFKIAETYEEPSPFLRDDGELDNDDN